MSESIKTVSEDGAAQRVAAQQVNVERLLEPVRLGPYHGALDSVASATAWQCSFLS